MERKNKRIKQLHKILKKRVQTKQTADKKRESINLKKWNENAKKIKLKNEIQQKWQERKDKIEAKDKIKKLKQVKTQKTNKNDLCCYYRFDINCHSNNFFKGSNFCRGTNTVSSCSYSLLWRCN